ncbi:hypothetical protein B0A48_18258 [Cryoendolithus antarcticus]|uniref:Exosome complex protein n=1 Tax=Cryoendolithus antarcticus TaxID=1507870 RepID=A0A1V8S926_9PEZI|nr:hypothetical protein B0A48_18258 [Cryoendolithus antarcticus]
MDTISPLLEDLTSSIDDLESALLPLLTTPTSTLSSKLPLLDKAKLHVLTTYALDSLLFSLLKVNGTDTRTHPISTEIARVKSYFGKISDVEKGPEERKMVVDRAAAGRFVRAGLAGNDAKGVKRGVDGVPKHLKFNDQGTVAVAKADDLESSDEESGETGGKGKADKKAAKRKRRMESNIAKQSPVEGVAESGTSVLSKGTSTPAVLPGLGAIRDQFVTEGTIPTEEGSAKKKKKKRKTRAEMQEKGEDEIMREML